MSKSKASKEQLREAMEKCRRRPFEMRPTVLRMRRAFKILLGRGM